MFSNKFASDCVFLTEHLPYTVVLMKRAFVFSALALVLVGCGSPTTLSYNITFDTQDKSRMNDLTQSSQRVMERRLARLGGELLGFHVDYTESENRTVIDVEVEPKEAADQLNAEMTEPFVLEVRVGEETEQEGDILVEGMGPFRATGVTGSDIDWVLSGDDEAAENALPKGAITIGFTDEGVKKMQELFQKDSGKPMGIFVRGRLAAKINLSNERITRTITIRGVPSREIADVFADDINVGLHMTFELLK